MDQEEWKSNQLVNEVPEVVFFLSQTWFCFVLFFSLFSFLLQHVDWSWSLLVLPTILIFISLHEKFVHYAVDSKFLQSVGSNAEKFGVLIMRFYSANPFPNKVSLQESTHRQRCSRFPNNLIVVQTAGKCSFSFLAQFFP